MTPHGSDIDRTEQWADWKARFLRPRASDRRRLRGASTISRCSPVMSSGPSPSIRTFSNSRSSNCSRTGTTGVRHTSSSISAMATTWPTSISPVSSSAIQRGARRPHHIAISVTPSSGPVVAKLRAAGVEPHIVNGDSAYFPGPDGERLELLSYQLSDMYGTVVAERRLDGNQAGSRQPVGLPTRSSNLVPVLPRQRRRPRAARGRACRPLRRSTATTRSSRSPQAFRSGPMGWKDQSVLERRWHLVEERRIDEAGHTALMRIPFDP